MAQKNLSSRLIDRLLVFMGSNELAAEMEEVLEGADRGTATLSAGSVVVSSSVIQSNSVVMLTYQGAPGANTTDHSLWVSNIVAGTSFKINANGGAETAVVAYLVVNP